MINPEVNPYIPTRGVIKSVNQETRNVKTLVIELDVPEFEFAPGQYNLVSVMGIGEAPLTVGSLFKDKKTITHTVRMAGQLTSKLSELGEGDTIGLRGPFGRGWPLEKTRDKDLVITAGGLGLAPLRSLIEMIERERQRFRRVNIAYGARTPADMIFTDQFDRWRAIPEFDLLLTVDSVPPGTGWKHGLGVVTTVFDQLTVDPANTVAFACGPEIMMRFVANSLLIRGIGEDSLFVSMERRMECGMGKCGHCMIGPKYVCMDGPVLSYAELKQLPHNLIAGRGLAA